MKRFILWLCTATVLLSGSVYAQVAVQTSKAPHIKTAAELQNAIAQVDSLYSAEFAKHGQGSITVGIVSGDKLVWTKSYGLADIKNHIPATKNSTYRIGSITKQFTATMLMQLVAEGKVHLTDPVVKYFPEFSEIQNDYPWSPPVTLLQLATHTSGLAREPEDEKKYWTGQVADWDKILLSAVPHMRFQYEPGTRFLYSNIGYAILGVALSRAAGEPYIEYVQQHILKPLGMTHTAFQQNDEILRTLAKGYSVQTGNTAFPVNTENGPDPTPSAAELRSGRGYKVPNGALFTTVGDLAHYLSFEMGDGPDGVLPKSVDADRFSRLYSADSGLKSGYGIGFFAYRNKEGVVEVGHGGWVAGYLSGAYFDRKSHIGLIYLRSTDAPGFSTALTLDAMKDLTQ